jgi:predicted kinase
MPTLTMTRGLPASGKSYWAAEQPDTVVVNKDDIRKELEIGGWKWSKEGEKHVIAIRDQRIEQALKDGKNVVSSDTNLAPKHKERFMQIAKQHKAIFIIKDFTKVPLDICIQRDSKRTEGQVGEKVIREMYDQYIKLPEVEPYVPDISLAPTIICDIDGTMAIHTNRSPYDHDKCDRDIVNRVVFNITHLFVKEGYKIVYLTGREDKFRFKTEDWLVSNGCPNGPLLMRPSGDVRKDYIVKQEIFDKCIRNVYNVRFALDDRDQVVSMWRRMGLTCLQVADGAF